MEARSDRCDVGAPGRSDDAAQEKVLLEAKAEPGAPVTFYTPQVVEFSNRLTTQSVEAAEDGIARATFTATAGTQGLVDILAASPLNSGQLRYRVRVSLPAQN